MTDNLLYILVRRLIEMMHFHLAPPNNQFTAIHSASRQQTSRVHDQNGGYVRRLSTYRMVPRDALQQTFCRNIDSNEASDTQRPCLAELSDCAVTLRNMTSISRANQTICETTPLNVYSGIAIIRRRYTHESCARVSRDRRYDEIRSATVSINTR